MPLDTEVELILCTTEYCDIIVFDSTFTISCNPSWETKSTMSFGLPTRNKISWLCPEDLTNWANDSLNPSTFMELMGLGYFAMNEITLLSIEGSTLYFVNDVATLERARLGTISTV